MSFASSETYDDKNEALDAYCPKPHNFSVGTCSITLSSVPQVMNFAKMSQFYRIAFSGRAKVARSVDRLHEPCHEVRFMVLVVLRCGARFKFAVTEGNAGIGGDSNLPMSFEVTGH